MPVLQRASSGAGAATPSPRGARAAAGGKKDRRLEAVSFCAVRLEIEDGYPDVDIHFSRGKSIEDIFEDLCFVGGTKSPEEMEKQKAKAKKARGRRSADRIEVETYTGFDEAASAFDKTEREATPSSTSTKESTPMAGEDSEGQKHRIKFKSGNPFVEVTKGVLHLFKENQTTSLEEGVIRSHMICMLNVPAKIKSPDLLQFTAPCHSELEMMRVIHDGSPNQYMVLLRFRCQEAADEFYQAFNGVPFNSFEEDVCTLVYVSKVETRKESEYYPLAGHTELPVCSICLERMDESVSTVLTILCNHTFHGSCLGKWEDSSCPVCRYVQTPEAVAEQLCSECQSAEDLWICLICGYVGCGRYVGGHSHAHFSETGHCYTMELGQNRVWDYVGDNFVHRLVQTDSADGKLVEAVPRAEVTKTVDGIPVNSDEKMDSIQLEYTYLLTSQLEAQRRYFEEKMARLELEATQEMEQVLGRARSSAEERQQAEEKLASLGKDKGKLDAKLAQLQAKVAKLSLDLNEEKEMNASLRSNQAEWQRKVTDYEKALADVKQSKDKEVEDLQEQLRDLMFYLEAQESIAKSSLKDEIKDGDIVVAAPAEKAPPAKEKKRKGKS